jgi:hypothetical protein
MSQELTENIISKLENPQLVNERGIFKVYTEMSKMECKQNNENALYLTKQKNCCLFLTDLLFPRKY